MLLGPGFIVCFFLLDMFLVNSTLNLMYLLFIYRLASTPAMFNSTLTQDDASSCPVDGSIMITGTLCSLFYFPFLLEGNKQLCLICFLLHHNTSSDYWDKHLIIVWLCKISRTRYNADAVLEAHILKKWMSNNKFFQVYCFWDYELAAICTPILWSWLSFFFTSFHVCPIHWLMIIFLIIKTASHLPYNRNGFKFFTNAGGLGKPDIKDILDRAADIYKKNTIEGPMESRSYVSASVKKVDYMAIYTSDLVKAVRRAAGNIGTWYTEYFCCLFFFLHVHDFFFFLPSRNLIILFCTGIWISICYFFVLGIEKDPDYFSPPFSQLREAIGRVPYCCWCWKWSWWIFCSKCSLYHVWLQESLLTAAN